MNQFLPRKLIAILPFYGYFSYILYNFDLKPILKPVEGKTKKVSPKFDSDLQN